MELDDITIFFLLQFLILFLLKAKQKRKRLLAIHKKRFVRRNGQRLKWVLHRSTKDWFFTNCVTNEDFRDREWVSTFRLRKASFTVLCDLLRRQLTRKNTNLRRSLCVEERVAIFLFRLGHGVSHNIIRSQFGVGKSTSEKIFKEVLDAIISEMSYFIQLPKSSEEALSISEAFERKRGLPNCFGAIDCTDFQLAMPSEESVVFRSHKKRYMLKAQVLVDSECLILDASIGYPGSFHDGRIFRKSLLSTANLLESYLSMNDSMVPDCFFRTGRRMM